MRFFPLLTVIFLLSLCACHTKKIITQEPEQEISQQQLESKNLKFYYGGTLTEVIERAEKEKKLVFIDFTADWCAPCKFMEEEVYTYKGVYELYNQNFINYRINIEKENGPNLAYLYEVKTLPALLFLDTKGRIVHRYTGSLGISGIIDLANEALSKNISE